MALNSTLLNAWGARKHVAPGGKSTDKPTKVLKPGFDAGDSGQLVSQGFGAAGQATLSSRTMASLLEGQQQSGVDPTTSPRSGGSNEGEVSAAITQEGDPHGISHLSTAKCGIGQGVVDPANRADDDMTAKRADAVSGLLEALDFLVGEFRDVVRTKKVKYGTRYEEKIAAITDYIRTTIEKSKSRARNRGDWPVDLKAKKGQEALKGF